ncbi:hypothetical protein BU189_16160, partial [Enterococcus faecium]|uniref:family 1 glycosylhydrolase n=1 Tax=Enterococcus faecium TaxID=1352 RepID=UPI000B565828
GRIGCIVNPEMVYARSNSPEDQKAAYMYDLFYNRVFFDTMVQGYYTEELLELFKKQSIYFSLVYTSDTTDDTPSLGFGG